MSPIAPTFKAVPYELFPRSFTAAEPPWTSTVGICPPDAQRFLACYGLGKDQLAAGHGVVQLESVAIVNDRVAVGQLIPRVER
jgi:hypothetical protein